MMIFHSSPKLRLAGRVVFLAGVLSISACTPKYDWREVRGTEAPFTVMMPSKPSVHARSVNLDGLDVTMTMTAAEVDGTVFAVGTAELPDATKAQQALVAMKIAMVKNINGEIKKEKTSATAQATGSTTMQTTSVDVEAVGLPAAGGSGPQRLLVARFTARDRTVYQAIVVGKEKSVSRDAVETFFSSFKVGQ